MSAGEYFADWPKKEVTPIEPRDIVEKYACHCGGGFKVNSSSSASGPAWSYKIECHKCGHVVIDGDLDRAFNHYRGTRGVRAVLRPKMRDPAFPRKEFDEMVSEVVYNLEKIECNRANADMVKNIKEKLRAILAYPGTDERVRFVGDDWKKIPDIDYDEDGMLEDLGPPAMRDTRPDMIRLLESI